MGAVLTIAKRDFISYFTSFKAAVIFWFFLFLLGIFFYSFVYTFLELHRNSSSMGGVAPTLEQFLAAIFNNINFILLLVVPAITMASFSEEKRTQVNRLLQTAPINATQVVLGKYLACCMIMGLVLLSSLVFPFFTLNYGNPDIWVIVTSYLGIFLLVCSQLSFGLWVSSMTDNQFLAFAFTMFGLFLLLILNWVAPNITNSEGVEGFVKFLASTTHLEVFLKGIISISDTIYFIAFSTLFLFFTNSILDSQRWR